MWGESLPSEDNACKHQDHLVCSSTTAAAVVPLWNGFSKARLIALEHRSHSPGTGVLQGAVTVSAGLGTPGLAVSPSGVLWCLCPGVFPRPEGKHFGSWEKLVGSTICRLRTGAGAARCAPVRHSHGKSGTKGTWRKGTIGKGRASAGC